MTRVDRYRLRHSIETKSADAPASDVHKQTFTKMATNFMRHLNHLAAQVKSSTSFPRIFPVSCRASRSMSSMTQPVRPRRFAPLDPARRKPQDDRPILKGIVFDVDGTLCE